MFFIFAQKNVANNDENGGTSFLSLKDETFDRSGHSSRRIIILSLYFVVDTKALVKKYSISTSSAHSVNMVDKFRLISYKPSHARAALDLNINGIRFLRFSLLDLFSYFIICKHLAVTINFFFQSKK